MNKPKLIEVKKQLQDYVQYVTSQTDLDLKLLLEKSSSFRVSGEFDSHQAIRLLISWKINELLTNH